MASQQHLKMLAQVPDIWNQWRVDNPRVTPDLSGACLTEVLEPFGPVGELNFRDADLRKAGLDEIYCTSSNFDGADLSEANLAVSELHQSSFVDANLRDACMISTGLVGANLTNADLTGADLNVANLRDANLSGATIVGVRLRNANMVETTVKDATFIDCTVYGISAWGMTGTPRKQENLIITREGEPTIAVDDLQVAQFVYLLLNHKNLRQVLNSVTERGVLMLGRFGGGGIEVLRAVAEKLRAMKYLPIIFDFDRPRDRNFTETVKTLVGLSRFVVVDLSGPSVPQELYATVPHFKIPFVPILEKGKRPYSIFADILEYDWVLKPVIEFDTTQTLIELLPSKIVEPAEKRLEIRQKLLHELFGGQ